MTKEEFMHNYKIKIWAHKWWYLDEKVPEKYIPDVRKYIKEHPEEFKGAVPM